MASTFKRVISDISTTPNGDYDVARVVGYGSVALCTLVFLFCVIYMVITKQTFSASDYAIGLGGIAALITAAAGGVLLKKSDEVPYKEYQPDLNSPRATEEEK